MPVDIDKYDCAFVAKEDKIKRKLINKKRTIFISNKKKIFKIFIFFLLTAKVTETLHAFLYFKIIKRIPIICLFAVAAIFIFKLLKK
jgi:hypothetical protein